MSGSMSFLVFSYSFMHVDCPVVTIALGANKDAPFNRQLSARIHFYHRTPVNLPHPTDPPQIRTGATLERLPQELGMSMQQGLDMGMI